MLNMILPVSGAGDPAQPEMQLLYSGLRMLSSAQAFRECATGA